MSNRNSNMASILAWHKRHDGWESTGPLICSIHGPKNDLCVCQGLPLWGLPPDQDCHSPEHPITYGEILTLEWTCCAHYSGREHCFLPTVDQR